MGFVTLGIFIFHRAGPPRRGPPDDCPRHHHGRPLPAASASSTSAPTTAPSPRWAAWPAVAGLRRDLRLLHAGQPRLARPGRLRRRVPGHHRRVRLLPVGGSVAALAMMLGAAYLLFMYQRVVFGDLSDFLKGIGHHLTDMNRDRDRHARAARRPGDRLRRLPGPAAAAVADTRDATSWRGRRPCDRPRACPDVRHDDPFDANTILACCPSLGVGACCAMLVVVVGHVWPGRDRRDRRRRVGRRSWC